MFSNTRKRDKLIPKDIGNWDCLLYWTSGEWQATKERLDETVFNPGDRELFAALRAVHPESVRVAIYGQDPYPQHQFCTGVAFSVPSVLTPERFPPTLKNILAEYQDDLHYPLPKSGDLSRWCEQGVLLWNVYPSCAPGKPGSHRWTEWDFLTKEITELLDRQEIVFVLLGQKAQVFSKYIERSPIIATSHPSPLGVRRGFKGSRIFSTVNQKLVEKGKKIVDWRL